MPLPQEQMTEVEARLGRTLPEDYREFLRDYGGYAVRACHALFAR